MAVDSKFQILELISRYKTQILLYNGVLVADCAEHVGVLGLSQ